MKLRVIEIFAVGSLAFVLGVLPQGAVQAKGTCYDQYKQPIPCPKSNYQLTQQANAKLGPSQTPVPETETPTATATDTPSPTPTATATAEPTQAAALVAQPVSLTPLVATPPAPNRPTASNIPEGLPWYAWLLGGAGLLFLAVVGLVRPALLTQADRVKPDLKDTADNTASQDGYVYTSLHSQSHDKAREDISTRPEDHTPR